MRDAGSIARWTVVLLAVAALLSAEAGAAGPPRAIAVLPFDASALEREYQWIGGAVAEVVGLGLAQHPAFIRVNEARPSGGHPTIWSEAAVAQAVRALRADAAVFGQVSRSGTDLVVRPGLVQVKGGRVEAVSLEPIAVPEGGLLVRLLAPLPGTYARTLGVTLTDAEAGRMEKAAQPTRSLKAFELYAQARLAVRQRPGQEGNERAVDLLARAVEADPAFAVAQYALGQVHQALGNHWKANAQFRAATQLDPSYPEPYKSLGDLFLTATRPVYEQAIEAYDKAIQLRPFYADAHVGLGDARAAKGDVAGAIGAYTRALAYNPANARVHASLGKIYYAEKGLYYESVNAYRKAIDLDPRSVEARMGLGEVYEDKGLYREAAEEYRRVIDLDGKHTGALYNLALVYERIDPREAIGHWEHYIAVASQLPSEKDWLDVARLHLRKLKGQIK
jgi:tetratricopeptide (TPR) repeat protein